MVTSNQLCSCLLGNLPFRRLLKAVKSNLELEYLAHVRWHMRKICRIPRLVKLVSHCPTAASNVSNYHGRLEIRLEMCL